MSKLWKSINTEKGKRQKSEEQSISRSQSSGRMPSNKVRANRKMSGKYSEVYIHKVAQT